MNDAWRLILRLEPVFIMLCFYFWLKGYEWYQIVGYSLFSIIFVPAMILRVGGRVSNWLERTLDIDHWLYIPWYIFGAVITVFFIYVTIWIEQ